MKKLGMVVVLVALGAGVLISQVQHIPSTATLRSECRVGDIVIKTGSSAGFYACITTNTWSGPFSMGSGTPGGSNTQVQFNDSSTFGGDSGFTYNKTTDTATLVNLTVSGTCTGCSGSSAAFPSRAEGRLTTETGVCVSSSDRTAQSTIYYTPGCANGGGNHISLYVSSAWTDVTFSEVSKALSSLTSGKNYDVFFDYNGGTHQLVLSAAWTNDTTRADAIAQQDGVWVKSADHSLRLVGTIRTTGTSSTEDSAAKRFVANAANLQARTMFVIDTTNSWNYTTSTWRQANANTANQLDFVTSLAANAFARVHGIAFGNNQGVATGVGVDSTSSNSAHNWGADADNGGSNGIDSVYEGMVTAGRHTLVWLEIANATGTVTWYGDNNNVFYQSGISGRIWN